MQSDEQIQREWESLDNDDIKQICNILSKHETKIQEYLINCVAALCDVPTDEMMTSTSNVSCVHARWFFWYTYRYMTNEPFAKIAERTNKNYGRLYSIPTVANGVNKISEMIASNGIWNKRWVLIKRIIKQRNTSEINGQIDNNRVVINVPKDMKTKVSVNFNE